MSRQSGHHQPPELCVLVVEDEVGTQDALSTLLELDGWLVMQAYDGEQALAQLGRRTPDVIVTDYMMPNVDGLTLMQALGDDERWSAIPVILVSATDLPAEARRHARAFLRKPIDLCALRKVLAALTGSDRRGPGRRDG